MNNSNGLHGAGAVPELYIITNRHNGNQYVGCTKYTAAARWKQHLAAAARGSRMRLCGAIRKYGADGFDVAIHSTHRTHEDVLAAETVLIEQMKPEYNTAAGGRGAVGMRWSAGRRKLILAKIRGRKWSDRERAAWEARRLTDAPRGKGIQRLDTGAWFISGKIAAAAAGIKTATLNGAVKAGWRADGTWWVRTNAPLATADRLALLASRVEQDDAWKAKRLKGTNVRGIDRLDVPGTWRSAAEAARELGINKTRITQSCQNGETIYGKMRFKYADQAEPVVRQWITEEERADAKRRTLEGLAKARAGNRKKVICLDTGDVFPSITHAAEWVGARVSRVSVSIHTGIRCRKKRFAFVDGEAT